LTFERDYWSSFFFISFGELWTELVKENYLQLALFKQEKHVDFLSQSGTRTMHSVTFISCAYRRLHVFPHLTLHAFFPALGTEYMSSRAFHRLHAFFASCLLEKPLHSIECLPEIRAAGDSKNMKERRPQISAARLNNIKPALN